MRGRAAWLFTWALLSCKGGTLQKDDGELTLSPSSLDFGTVYSGYRAQQTVMLDYTGKASCDVTLTATAPFSVTPSVHLAGSSPSNVVVSLTASAAGSLTGTLTASGCGHSTTATLSATAKEAPDCGSPGQCTTVTFDLDAGRCTTVQITDGTPCGDACLTQPRCSGGQCAGVGIGCDDSDPCTLDACSADGGCVHIAANTFCPPLPGCAAVCDGGSCGSLIEVWNADTSAGVLDPLVADEAGNVYWLEVDYQSTFQGWLVSRGRSGALRFRVAVNLVNALTPRPMYSTGVFVLSRVASRYVTAFRASDGSPLWERDLHDDVEQAGHPELEHNNIEVERGTVGASSELVFPIDFSFGGASTSTWMVALEPATGQTAWRAPLSHEARQLTAGSEGRIEAWWPSQAPTSFDAYDFAGQLQWSVAQPPGPTALGRVYSTVQILDADAGGVDALYATATTIVPDVVTAAYGVHRDLSFGNFIFFDPLTGATIREDPVRDAPDWDLYAATGGELIAVNLLTEREVDGFDSDGGRLYRCALPLEKTDQIFDHTALVDNLLLVWTQDAAATRTTLHAYVLAGRAEASSGWTARYGSMARTSRAK